MLLTYSPPSLTGLYDTPTLSVEPRSEVTSGENVTFHCQLATATSTFFLLKRGRSSRPQLRYGNLRAEFHLGPVTPAHGGTYRCFGSYNNHAWSFPSKPVKLLVKGEDLPLNFAPCPFWISKWPPNSDEDGSREAGGVMQRRCFAPMLSSTLIPRGPGASESMRTIATEMEGRGAGMGEGIGGKTRPLDLLLVSSARRCRGHHLRAHRTHLFWWVTDTSKLRGRTQSLPTTLKSWHSFTISLECTEQAMNYISVSQPDEDPCLYGTHNL